MSAAAVVAIAFFFFFMSSSMIAQVHALAGSGGNRIAVIGGGASGIFAAIAAGSKHPHVHPSVGGGGGGVTVLEAGSRTLTKVKISGGGRCNVLHDTAKPIDFLLAGYPRGKKELNGLLNKRFTPAQAQRWFEQRGVDLKTEADGRMFPTTDSSQTIIDTLLNAAEDAGVEIRRRCKVETIERTPTGSFKLSLVEKDGTNKVATQQYYDAIILATGSAPIGYQLVSSLGHSLVSTVPSLFTLNAKLDVKEGGLLHELSGVSVQQARVSFRLPSEAGKKRKTIEQEGPLLITHHGLSGPAALRLSAFGARKFADANYRGDLAVHWAPALGTADQISDNLWKMTATNPKKAVSTVCPLTVAGGIAIPKRLWSAMVSQAGFTTETVWAEAPKKLVRKLAMQISDCPIQLTGKGTFKEEFVTRKIHPCMQRDGCH
jgi:predicted Rossmann fold flavoprotein